MRVLDRRTLLRAGLAVGGAGVLGGCDSAGNRPGSAYGGTEGGAGGAAQGTVAGSLILPGSPPVAEAERARFTTGRVRSLAITLTSGIGEAYTPTLVGVDGTVYAVNNAILFAIGN